MSDYIAPFLLSQEALDSLPDGVFIVPVCTTRERFEKITNALWQGAFPVNVAESYDHLVDWLEAIPRIRAGCEYDPTDACNVIALNDPRITWHPESPYDVGAEVPEGYLHHPWTIVTNSIIDQIVLQWGLGYKAGDVLTDFQKIPAGESWENILSDGYLIFPRFRINDLEGNGTVKLHLLNIPQGGRAWILVDDVIYLDLPKNKFVELDTDLTSFPPETNAEVIIEIEIEGVGTHHLDVVYIPAMDVAFIPLFFGGGVRAIELCGFGMPLIDPCCPDQTDILLKIFQQNNTYMSFVTNLLYDGVAPESFAPDAPENYDSDTDDTNPDARLRALCAAVTRYVYNVLSAVVQANADSDAVGDILEQFPPFGIVLGLVDFAVDVAGDALAGLMGDTAAINDVICHMLGNLNGQPTTQEAFRDSVDPGAFTVLSNQWQIAIMIDVANASQANWRAFVSMLPEIYDTVAGGGAVDCPCDCEDDIELTDFANTGTVITPMGDCIYKFFQSVPIFETGSDRYYHSFRDTLGRCLHIENTGDVGMPTQAVSNTTAVDCAGVETNFVGGFEGGELRSAHWRMALDTTYLKITLADE